MVIFKKEYKGFEDSYDVYRDVSEALDADFTPIWKSIGGEWLGTLKITIEYVDEKGNDTIMFPARIQETPLIKDDLTGLPFDIN